MFAVKARGPGAPADSKEAKKDAKPPVSLYFGFLSCTHLFGLRCVQQVPEGKVLRMLEKPSSYRLFAPKV